MDLLATLVVLVILGSVLGTAFASIRPNTRALVCLNNQRQLANAWRLYATEHEDELPPNRDGGNAGKSRSDASWAGGWLDYTSNTDNTNTDLLVNHTRYPYAAYLGPYVRTPAVFKCPADTSQVSIAGQWFPRVRSVSMNNALNGRLWSTSTSFPASYEKLTQIKFAAKLFVILDEHPGSINDPCFFSDPSTPFLMVDFPASYHDGAGSFSFADGHAELHKWRNPRTTPRRGLLIPLNVILPGDADVTWLQQHAAQPN